MFLRPPIALHSRLDHVSFLPHGDIWCHSTTELRSYDLTWVRTSSLADGDSSL
jgi:hypothetical protein